MKTTYLLRHAQADRGRPGVRDFERPLALAGRKEAALLAQRVKGLARPDLVLCSSARRARETYDAMSSCLGRSTPVEFSESLYLAPAARLIRQLSGLSSDVSIVLLVGHNPGLQAAAVMLAGAESEPNGLREIRQDFAAGALAVISFDFDDWRHLAPGKGRLLKVLAP